MFDYVSDVSTIQLFMFHIISGIVYVCKFLIRIIIEVVIHTFCTNIIYVIIVRPNVELLVQENYCPLHIWNILVNECLLKLH